MKLSQLQEARYATRQKLKLSDFTPGDHIIITTRSLRGTERRFGKVRFVDYNDLRGITFAGAHRDDMLPTGQGHLTPEDIGKGPYGIQHVEIIKRRDPQRRHRQSSRPQIREARYHKHPAVNWLEKKMAKGRPLSDRLILTKEQFVDFWRSLPKELGAPQERTTNQISMWWIIKNKHGEFDVDLQHLIGPPKDRSLRLSISSRKDD